MICQPGIPATLAGSEKDFATRLSMGDQNHEQDKDHDSVDAHGRKSRQFEFFFCVSITRPPFPVSFLGR